MKIACQSCQAKYTIADEKVVGKIVKIRCKKCGATIVINGNDPEATNPLPAGEGGSEWTVNVAEGDQRTMTSEEIIDGYRGGVVTDETFCWKDGMADWLPLREIDELYQAVSGGGAAAAGGADFAPLSVRGFDDQATVPLQRENMGGLFGGGAAHAESNGNGASLFGGGAAAPAPASAPPAARRVGGRGAGGADLFGSAAAAGGEDDVMTSAASGSSGGGNHAAEEPGKLTGQRNENSVLFSLNALTSSGPKVEKEKPTADGSGLIDIRALSSTMANDTGKKKDHVDDIMNLGGGGAFNAPLAAPILAPPLAGADVTDGGTPVADKQKKMLIMIIAAFGGVIVLFMIVVVYFLTRTPKLDDTTAGGREALSGSVASSAASGGAAPTDTTAGSAVAAGTTTAPTGGGALPPGTGAVAQNTAPTTHAEHSSGGGGGSHAASHSGGGDTTPTPPSGGGGGGAPDLMSAMNAASPGVKPTGGGGGGGGGGSAPFDRGAAAGALGSIAGSLQGCAKPGGPTGAGHAKITFSPNGNVKSVDVDQPPFQGSSVGGCIASKFRAAHIPAFSGGDSPPLGKSFNIN